MILECDIGNTRCKWRLQEAATCIERGVLSYVDDGFHGLATNPAIERVRVACVAGREQELQLQAWVTENLGLSCEFARTQSKTAGLCNSYAEPEKMGVDRWLAAVAAYHSYNSAVLVIDIGSALTAEFINGKGEHLGGYIIPGEALMKKSLLAGTGRVRFEDEPPASLVPGRSTAEAVSYGVAVSMLGTVKQIIEQGALSLPANFNIVLTGGGAEFVRPYLPDEVDWCPELVMDGLGWLLP